MTSWREFGVSTTENPVRVPPLARWERQVDQNRGMMYKITVGKSVPVVDSSSSNVVDQLKYALPPLRVGESKPHDKDGRTPRKAASNKKPSKKATVGQLSVPLSDMLMMLRDESKDPERGAVTDRPHLKMNDLFGANNSPDRWTKLLEDMRQSDDGCLLSQLGATHGIPLPHSKVPEQYYVTSVSPISQPNFVRKRDVTGAITWKALEFPSENPLKRAEVFFLARCLDSMQEETLLGNKLDDISLDNIGAVRSEFLNVLDVGISEIIRQVQVHCVERGILLKLLTDRMFHVMREEIDRAVFGKSLQEKEREENLQEKIQLENEVEVLKNRCHELEKAVRDNHEVIATTMSTNRELSEKIDSAMEANENLVADMEIQSEVIDKVIAKGLIAEKEVAGFREELAEKKSGIQEQVDEYSCRRVHDLKTRVSSLQTSLSEAEEEQEGVSSRFADEFRRLVWRVKKGEHMYNKLLEEASAKGGIDFATQTSDDDYESLCSTDTDLDDDLESFISSSLMDDGTTKALGIDSNAASVSREGICLPESENDASGVNGDLIETSGDDNDSAATTVDTRDQGAENDEFIEDISSMNDDGVFIDDTNGHSGGIESGKSSEHKIVGGSSDIDAENTLDDVDGHEDTHEDTHENMSDMNDATVKGGEDGVAVMENSNDIAESSIMVTEDSSHTFGFEDAFTQTSWTFAKDIVEGIDMSYRNVNNNVESTSKGQNLGMNEFSLSVEEPMDEFDQSHTPSSTGSVDDESLHNNFDDFSASSSDSKENEASPGNDLFLGVDNRKVQRPRSSSDVAGGRSSMKKPRASGVSTKNKRNWKKLGMTFGAKDTWLQDILEVPESGTPTSKLWICRLISTIYREKITYDASESAVPAGGRILTMPQFLYTHLKEKYGTGKLVDDYARRIVGTCQLMRNEDLRIEIFSRFLSESWDLEALNFFLKSWNMLDVTRIGPQLKNAHDDGVAPSNVSLKRCLHILPSLISRSLPVYKTITDKIWAMSSPLRRSDFNTESEVSQTSGRSVGGVTKNADMRKIPRSEFLFCCTQTILEMQNTK